MLNSVLLQNIATLKEALREKVSYVDVNAFGINSTTDSIEVLNQDCTIQKLKIWLQSDEFDYYRRPGYGGFITRHVIKKPFTESNCKGIEDELRTEIAQFFPMIEVLRAKVSCNFTLKRWEIRLAVYDKEIGLENIDLENQPLVVDVE